MAGLVPAICVFEASIWWEDADTRDASYLPITTSHSGRLISALRKITR